MELKGSTWVRPVKEMQRDKERFTGSTVGPILAHSQVGRCTEKEFIFILTGPSMMDPLSKDSKRGMVKTSGLMEDIISEIFKKTRDMAEGYLLSLMEENSSVNL